jgi:hypothetical protein
MESKPTVEHFMTDFFRERTAALKMVLEKRRDYRLRYYHSECEWDSRDGCVERSEAEKIVEVSPSDIRFCVVTTGNGLHRLRYHVKPFGESWSIHEVDSECGHSRIFGASYECDKCGGTGWLTWQQRDKFISSRLAQHPVSRTTRPSPSEELDEARWREPILEQFMTDYFRDRTLAWKKEREIYGDRAKHFYSPECDWTRWIVSAEHSEIERIVSIVPVDTGAHITTNGFGFQGQRLRYNLSPEAQSWLIRKVDLECPFCSRHGRRVDCTWCGGTIWEHKKADRGPARGEQPGDDPPPETPRWKFD